MKKKRIFNAVTAFVMAAVIAFTAAIVPIPAQAATKSPPAKVTGVSVNSTSAGTVTVKWKKASKAKGYQIAYATNSKFNGKQTKKISNAKVTSKTISGLKQGKKYYVRIRAYNKSGTKTNYGSWSKTKSVTVKKASTSSAPGKVTLSSVKSDKAGEITVTWKKVSNASGYQVMYAENSQFTSGAKTKTFSGGANTSATLSNLTGGKVYYVQVRAYQTSGKTTKYGSWSSAQTATAASAQTAAPAYEKYDNGLISMDIPKGWKVRVLSQNNDYIGYGFSLENPKDPRYSLTFYRTMGLTYGAAFHDNKKAADFWTKVYGGDYILVNPVTPEGFFRGIFEKANGKFQVVRNLGAESLSGAGITGMLRATVTDQKGQATEGIFLTTLSTICLAPYIYDSWFGGGYLGALNLVTAYGTTIISAPVGKLDSWTDTLIRCLGTIQYSDKFEDEHKKQWKQISDISAEITLNHKQISDAIMKGWEEMNK